MRCETYIVELRESIELHSIIAEFGVHVGRFPAVPAVIGTGHQNDPAVPAGRGSGEDDGKQLQSQQKVTEVVHLCSKKVKLLVE